MSAMAEALRAGGVTSPWLELIVIARRAIAASPRDIAAVRVAIWNDVRDDNALLRALFERVQRHALDTLIGDVVKTMATPRREPEGGGQGFGGAHTARASSDRAGGGQRVIDTQCRSE